MLKQPACNSGFLLVLCFLGARNTSDSGFRPDSVDFLCLLVSLLSP